jgi:hypothetical protein
VGQALLHFHPLLPALLVALHCHFPSLLLCAAVLIVFGATGTVGQALLQCVMKDTHLGKDVKVRAWKLYAVAAAAVVRRLMPVCPAEGHTLGQGRQGEGCCCKRHCLSVGIQGV